MIDWIAGIIELIGLYVVGNKNKYGFVISMIGNATWVIYVLVTNQTYGLLLVVVPALFINLRNFIKWLKESKKKKRKKNGKF